MVRRICTLGRGSHPLVKHQVQIRISRGSCREEGDRMPLFLCRWLNGNCSVVWARTTDDAIIELDQIANAQGSTDTRSLVRPPTSLSSLPVAASS